MRLYKLDDTMRANYAVTQRLVGESRSTVILAESIVDPTEDDLIMLLGRVSNDRDLAVNAFGRKLEYRMDVELMGEGARSELMKKASPHHPFIEKSWMKYQEHRMPEEK